MMEFGEYTPAMMLLMVGEIGKELQQFDGMNTVVVSFVVAYLIIKLVLEHTVKNNKAKIAEDQIDSTKKLTEGIEDLIKVLKER